VRRALPFLAGLALLVAIAAVIASTGNDDAGSTFGGNTTGSPLVGVVWEWEELLSSDDSTITPDDPSSYTIEFEDDGSVSVRADCNSGFGTYEAEGESLVIDVRGPTRAQCQPGSLSDRFLTDLGFVRAYVIEDGTLFLDLMADAGTMRFRPA
jgi:para-nitrobenzyl esterase